MAILGKKGVTPEMEFKCNDCSHTVTGQAVLNGEYLHIIEKNTVNPTLSVFRCECCQDDWEENNCSCED